MNGDRPRRSIVLGVALKVAAAMTLANALIFTGIYLDVRSDTRSLAQTAIDADLAGLVDGYAARGLPALSQVIGDRLAFQSGQGAQPYYRLEDGRRHVVAGNLPIWPAAHPEISQAGIARLPDGTTVQYRATLLQGGVRLLVGRSTAQSDDYLARIGALFSLGIALTIGAAFLIGRISARALNQRITGINEVFRHVGVDPGGARARVSKSDDEIDALSCNLNQVLDRIDRLLTARKELSDLVAHETRSPLMHIGATITRARTTGLPGEADLALEAAQDQIRALERMLDALLDIAASEAQRGEMNSLPSIDLSEIAGRLAELYEPSAEAMGIRLEADLAPAVMMRGDPMQITSLIGNLLDNAFKYGAAGGVIRLAVKKGPVIVVEDEGAGVDQAIRQTLFERFSRSQGAGKGHGLGLALVRAIAERHGLNVRLEDVLESGEERGARFIIQ